MPPPPDDPSWRAIVERDPTADGRFVYAVETTGVYCRPSCPARTPHRANVRLYPAPRDAERAGYRACRRCVPDGRSPAEQRADTIAALCRYIDTSDAPPTVAELAARAGWSPSHLSRTFRRTTGLTPRRYIAEHRAQRVRAALDDSPTVTDAVYDAGYSSTGRFYDPQTDPLGMTPTTWRRGGEGETIRFAVGATTLGALLVAATPRGLCAVDLGDDPAALVDALQDRFDRAELIGDDPDFDRWVAHLVAHVEDPRHHPLDLPLDLRGTAFQRRVWTALRALPCGETITYATLARAIGAPTAARAVARACATNPIALAIPCHRVVRRDGAPSGYRWGIDRKRALLAREAPRTG